VHRRRAEAGCWWRRKAGTGQSLDARAGQASASVAQHSISKRPVLGSCLPAPRASTVCGLFVAALRGDLRSEAIHGARLPTRPRSLVIADSGQQPAEHECHHDIGQEDAGPLDIAARSNQCRRVRWQQPRRTRKRSAGQRRTSRSLLVATSAREQRDHRSERAQLSMSVK